MSEERIYRNSPPIICSFCGTINLRFVLKPVQTVILIESLKYLQFALQVFGGYCEGCKESIAFIIKPPE